MADPSTPGAGPFPPDPIQLLVEASEIAADHPLELEDLLRALADLVRKVVAYQLFAVLLADEEGNLTIRYSIGYRPELVERLHIRPGQGITGHAALSRKTIVVDDVRRDPRYLSAVDAVRSEIAVPLVARGKLVGVVDLQSPQRNAFGERERNLLELIASRFSLAIDAAQLYQSTARQNRTLKTLAEIAREFSQILHLDDLLSQVSNRVRDLIRYDAFSIYLLEPGSETLKHYFGVRFDQRVQWQSMPLGQGLVGAAAETRRPILARDTKRDDRYVAVVEGIRCEAAVPLILKDQVIGVLDLESDQVNAFNEEDLQTLELLAPQVAGAIENARLYSQVLANQERMSRDLTAARHLQGHLLPYGFPEFEGLDVAARTVSAVEVSGDLYDFHIQAGRRFGLLTGDVTGKGAAAALYAALSSGLLRSLAPEGYSPRELFHELNEALLERPVEARYLVAIYAQWDPAARTLKVASAGQPRPILRRGGEVMALDIGGTPLGVISPGVYDEVEFELASGDLLVTASDGVHETPGPKGEDYGDERLLALVRRSPELSAAELVEAIFEDVERFSGRHTPADDRTVAVLRVE